ncbi:hypothetical protein PSN45_001858 [Yamadazyma tenuis]|nr:uncharacterized protein CANTEDRAFT_136864 [Yamadazyma tenuis ATCC 10573]EGV60381.1 hypothetical protein CANTEDRAFT_136864 [Yamadazyma tenuis ATCC 10573]WEJ94374.1 hypothetical protein PSN45_001858 [Yamadazyma tenuis]
MGYYSAYQLGDFFLSDETSRSIFLPLWINFNYFFKSSYSESNLKYLDIENFSFDTQSVNKRIKFKILNLLVNNKTIAFRHLLHWANVELVNHNTSYRFQVNCPSISGLKFVATKPIDNCSITELEVTTNWAIKLINLRFFLLNQPTLQFTDISYSFVGEYDVFEDTHVGKVKVDGIVENNDIKFRNVSLVLHKNNQEIEYKVI